MLPILILLRIIQENPLGKKTARLKPEKLLPIGKTLIDQIEKLDSEIKEGGDVLELENAYVDAGFPTTYEAVLNAGVSAQQTEKLRLDGLLKKLRTVIEK
jgi:hypothetical protein